MVQASYKISTYKDKGSYVISDDTFLIIEDHREGFDLIKVKLGDQEVYINKNDLKAIFYNL